MWERVRALTPMLVEYSAMVPSGTGVGSLMGKRILKCSHAAVWAGMKLSSGKLLAMVIDNKVNFNFKSFTFVPTGVHRVKILEEPSPEVVLEVRSSVPPKTQFFLGDIDPLYFRLSWSPERG